jgi:hypothetical protein
MAEHATDLLVLLSAAALSFLWIHTKPRIRPVPVRVVSRPRT